MASSPRYSSSTSVSSAWWPKLKKAIVLLRQRGYRITERQRYHQYEIVAPGSQEQARGDIWSLLAIAEREGIAL